MTPYPNSPIFIQNEVPEYACENAHKLTEIVKTLREDIVHSKWKGINEKDLSLTYNTYNGETKIQITFTDNNFHIHIFTMQLVPDNGFGYGEDSFRILYSFKGEFSEETISVRSFAEYIAVHLEWEAFEPELTDCSKGLIIPCKIEHSYEGICRIIDITLSKLKPIEWFNSKELNPMCYSELLNHFSEVLSQLQDEAKKGRWDGITMDSIKLESYKDENECSILLEYYPDNSWKWLIHIDAIWFESYADLCYSISYYPTHVCNKEEWQKFDIKFVEFLEAIPDSKGNLYIGGGTHEHSMHIQYFHLEETFDLFSNLLDKVITNLKRFNLNNGYFQKYPICS